MKITWSWTPSLDENFESWDKVNMICVWKDCEGLLPEGRLWEIAKMSFSPPSRVETLLPWVCSDLTGLSQSEISNYKVHMDLESICHHEMFEKAHLAQWPLWPNCHPVNFQKQCTELPRGWPQVEWVSPAEASWEWPSPRQSKFALRIKSSINGYCLNTKQKTKWKNMI